MDDPNVIATLIANGTDLAKRAFQFEHNKERYQAPTGDTRPFSKENTPCPGDGSDDEYSSHKEAQDKDATLHRLQLSFDKPPKNAKDGFVFGWDPDCDIQLVDRLNYRPEDRNLVERVSKNHFSITFDAERNVILRDTSTNRTAVSYDGQAGNEHRRQFTWIIFPGFEKIEISIPSADISFIIKLGKHENCEEEFAANVDRVFPPNMRMGEGGLATPFRKLDVQSNDTSVAPSGLATPRHRPIYLQHERIGKGTFGRVYRLTNVSTGDDYAGKFIDHFDCKREVAIMRQIDHENIVRFVEYRETPTPVIFMEHLTLGNLDDVHAVSPIAFEETLTILSQALRAETYLNNRGVIHRDIKPANILVSSRDPLIIKLADLGLAKHDRDGLSKFETFVGTNLYAAPEIYEWKEKPYTYAADIWSLGIVALELAYGLPQISTRNFNPKKWFQKVFDFVDALDSDQLIDFLDSDMLRYRPKDRLVASECLEKATSIELELGIQKAMQSSSPQNASQIAMGTPTEKAPVLTTLLWVPTGSSKRYRSPDLSAHADYNKKATIRQERNTPLEYVCSQTYPIANASLWFNGQHGPICESILELLRDIQIDGDGATDSRTFELVRELCRKLEEFQITEIVKSFDGDTEQTILTAVTKARAFPLASLTSSDLANTVTDLASQLHTMVDLSLVRRSMTNGSVSSTNPVRLDFPELPPIVSDGFSSLVGSSPDRGCMDGVASMFVPSYQFNKNGNSTDDADDAEMHAEVSISEHTISLRVNGMPIHLKSVTGEMDASEIIAISYAPKNEQKTLRDRIIRETGGLYRGAGAIWITYGHSRLLANNLGVLHELQVLFDYGDNNLCLPKTLPSDSLALYLEIFDKILTGSQEISLRRRDHWVNASHILMAAGVNRKGRTKDRVESMVNGQAERVLGVPRVHQGLYVSLQDALLLCEHYGFSELKENLRLLDQNVQVTLSHHEACDQGREQSLPLPRLTLSPVFSAQYLPFPVVEQESLRSKRSSTSWQTSLSKGWTYPSTVSGCSIPS